ncbi:ABC transporter substrate-binding protein [Noviherbaspirillum massiliense]|uniref:ABC transporter substrate-binding protein n=1 Tax=Noviherbaspirillum massiliense TaxID=1465823 RepID=UPI000367BDBD|nr:ABC transporter substrate-binding protein [Noviherbaspirillum massiliense]
MKVMKSVCRHAAVAAILYAALGLAASHAEPGVTPGAILIGQSAALTGTPAEEVKQATAGAQLYFDGINKKGGIHGRKIILETMDDGFVPKRTVENTKKLIEEKNVFALFLYRGTPTTEAVLPMITEAKIPLIAPVTGASSLHEPMPRYLFNVRTKYRDEVGVIVRQISAMGMQRLAAVASNDSFGEDALAGLKAAAKERNLPEPVIAKYERNTTAVEGAAKAILAAQPQAVLMFCTAKPCEAFIHEYRRQGGFQPLFALSNVSSRSFIQSLGEQARGLGLTQVFPNPGNITIGVVKEFIHAVKDAPELAESYPALEGFISAKVLAEGLRKAGASPTREGLVAALESFRGADVGGLTLNYSPSSRDGFNFVELTVVGRRGAVVR